MDKKEIPVLKAFPTKNGGQWKVFCHYCLEWHHHGPVEGHRVTHCTWETPYTRSGYFIRLVEKAAEE